MEHTILSTDVLVIGGGGAAARAAYEADAMGADVILAVKGDFGAVGTRGSGSTGGAISPFGVFATPGWTGNVTKGEIPMKMMIGAAVETAYKNILQVGLGMADPKLAQVLVTEAVDTRKKMLELGCDFGEYGVRSHGIPIMATFGSILRRSNVKILERTMVFRLIVENGECAGAYCVNEMTGEEFVIKAGAVIMATGGDANLFLENLGSPCNSGDGYTMGYEAGAALTNMEFKQIFLGTMSPNKNMLIRPLPKYAHLFNKDGEEFLEKYLPDGATVEECLAQRNAHNPFSTRDALSRFVDIAIQNEVKDGRGTEHNAVYLDLTDSRNPLPDLPRREFYEYRGVDFSKPIEVGVNQHCSLGGFIIDENAETTVPNLFAAGECAAGPHGADRIGGCMLLASQVFGAKAGKVAAERAMGKKRAELSANSLDEIKCLISGTPSGDIDPMEARKELQTAAYYDVLVVRNAAGLENFLGKVASIEAAVAAGIDWSTPAKKLLALELKNMLTLANIEALACMERKESRGPHYRSDYPMQDDSAWVKNVRIQKVAGKPFVDTFSFNEEWVNIGDKKLGYWA